MLWKGRQFLLHMYHPTKSKYLPNSMFFPTYILIYCLVMNITEIMPTRCYTTHNQLVFVKRLKMKYTLTFNCVYCLYCAYCFPLNLENVLHCYQLKSRKLLSSSPVFISHSNCDSKIRLNCLPSRGHSFIAEEEALLKGDYCDQIGK